MLCVLLCALLHDESIVASEVRVSDREVVWAVDVGIGRLQKGVAFPVDPPDLLAEDVEKAREEIARYLRTAFTLEVNGRPVALETGRTEPRKEAFLTTGELYVAHVRQELVYRSAEDIRTVKLRFAPFKDGMESRSTVRVGRVRGAEEPKSWALHAETGAFEIDLETGTSLGKFVLWGMHHIFIGYDHIAFLLALLLAARRMPEMLKIVTSFTVAHSVTLLLAALDVVRLQPAVTEALIAASIVYVAVENYLIQEAKYRWVLTFGFGLIHGLGFAGVLRERLEMLDAIAAPVIAFNVGVELGQVAILLVAFPLLYALRRSPDEAKAAARQKWIVRIGSAPVGLFGAAWLADRLNLLPWKLMEWLA